MPSLEENRRPDIQTHHPWTKELTQLIGLCWRVKSTSRPEFSKVVDVLEVIGKKYNVSLQHISPDLEKTPRMPERIPKSPDMSPFPFLPEIPPCEYGFYSSFVVDSHTPLDNDEEYDRESETDSSYKIPHGDLLKRRKLSTISSGHEGDPESPSVGTCSSILTDGGDCTHIRTDSPPPLDETLANRKDERRYRMLLQHEFHPSCTFRLFKLICHRHLNYPTVTLPLWSPSNIEIGSVGYLRKPEGEFVTLFNAFDPPQTSNGMLRGMANLYGYGKVSQGDQRQDRRGRAQRSLDVIRSWLTSKLDPSVYPHCETERVSQFGVGTTSTDDIRSV